VRLSKLGAVVRGPDFPSLVVGAAAALLGVGIATSVAGGDEEFNNSQLLWLRLVDGGNHPIEGQPRDDVTMFWSACLDGDLYMVSSPPVGAVDKFLAVDIERNYEFWCADGRSTDHDPFGGQP